MYHAVHDSSAGTQEDPHWVRIQLKPSRALKRRLGEQSNVYLNGPLLRLLAYGISRQDFVVVIPLLLILLHY